MRGARFGCGGGLTNFVPQPDGLVGLRYLIPIQIPRGCDGLSANLTVAHELLHALGLDHSRGRCVAVLAVGQACKKRIVFGSRPLQSDDLRGIRAAWRNTRPKVAIQGGQSSVAGGELSFNYSVTDRQNNIARMVWDFGDGGSPGNRLVLRTKRGYFSAGQSGASHTFARPGTYKVTLTVVDTYGKRARASTTVAVVAQPQPQPGFEE